MEINNEVEYKIKKITKLNKVEEYKEKIFDIVYSNWKKSEGKVLSYYSSDLHEIAEDLYLIIDDMSKEQTNIPSLIKNRIKANFKRLKTNSLNIILIKDNYENIKESDTSNSLILHVDEIKINSESVLISFKNDKPTIVDLKQMFNPQR
jgi:hypothetical protein